MVASMENGGAEPTEDGSQIDVLVLYTTDAQEQQGGTDGIGALIDLWVADTNMAYEDSGVTQRIALAHAQAVEYAQASTLEVDLRRLSSPTDGFLDEIHRLRNEYQADLVHLIVGARSEGSTNCGIAYVMQTESLIFQSGGFGVTASDCTGPVFAHELGHNMGLAHDRYESDFRGIYPYSFGYVNQRATASGNPDSAGWKTIMAGTSAQPCPGPCPTLLRFSNPDQTYNGDPLGVQADHPSEGLDGPADARTTLDNTRRFVASFRSAACTDFSVSPSTRIVPASGGETVFYVETAPGCLWDASSDVDFLETSTGPEAGTGVARFAVAATTDPERTGTVTVAGQAVTIRQMQNPGGVCGRTTQVSDQITRAAGFPDLADCAHITEAHLRDIRYLQLVEQGLTGLKPNDFSGLSNLQTLDLSNNRLSELPGGVFDGLTALDELRLYQSGVTELTERLFTDTPALTRLDLRENALVTLRAGAFSGLSNLESLNMWGNPLESLSQGAFSGLATLRNLNLGSNELTALPERAFVDLRNLSFLNLEYNRLGSLPANAFAGLSAMEFLRLHGNGLRALPGGLFDDLSSLKTLWLFQNELTQLPDRVFAGLTNLERLDVSGNQISELTTVTFDGLSRLIGLDLGHNRLAALPEDVFHAVSSLEYLILDGNDLATLPTNLLASPRGLQTLTVAFNRLTELPEGLLSGLSRLNALRLNGNPLSTLPDGFFAGLYSLESVWLGQSNDDPVDLSLDLIGKESPDPTASDCAAVGLSLPVGAPFDMNVRLVADQGSLFPGTAEIDTGYVESDEIAVAASGDAPVTVRIGEFPDLPASLCRLFPGWSEEPCYQGIGFNVGAELAVASATNCPPVDIPDAYLRAAIEQALDKQTGETIGSEELAALTSLVAVDQGISELIGLESADGLTSLSLSGNRIADLSPLADLTGLVRLDLAGNRISDVSPLAALIRLTWLNLGGNEIVDLSPLSALTALTRLWLYDNRIADVSALAPLTELTELSLRGNLVADLSPLAGLTKLRTLRLQNNRVMDPSPLLDNEGLGPGDFVDLTDNPLEENSVESHLVALANRGVDIRHGTRIRGLLAPFFPAASDTLRQGFVRVINRSSVPGEIVVDAVDDAGRRAGPTTLSIGADSAVHFNSEDLESGNASKGLPGGVGAGTGDWRLEMTSDLAIELLAYIRTPDGFLTAMHDLSPVVDNRYRVLIFNPARNRNQVSRLRLINPGVHDALVKISGIDDRGEAGDSPLRVVIGAGEARTLVALEVESGGTFEGALGGGAGKWQLLIESEQEILVINLLESPSGHMTNLSTTPRFREVAQ